MNAITLRKIIETHKRNYPAAHANNQGLSYSYNKMELDIFFKRVVRKLYPMTNNFEMKLGGSKVKLVHYLFDKLYNYWTDIISLMNYNMEKNDDINNSTLDIEYIVSIISIATPRHIHDVATEAKKSFKNDALIIDSYCNFVSEFIFKMVGEYKKSNFDSIVNWWESYQNS